MCVPGREALCLVVCHEEADLSPPGHADGLAAEQLQRAAGQRRVYQQQQDQHVPQALGQARGTGEGRPAGQTASRGVATGSAHRYPRTHAHTSLH